MDFLKNPEEIPEKTLELIGDFENEFKELAREYVRDEGRLVVFIDDLDRCIPKKGNRCSGGNKVVFECAADSVHNWR